MKGPNSLQPLPSLSLGLMLVLTLGLGGCDSAATLTIAPSHGEMPTLETRFLPSASGGGTIAVDEDALPERLREARTLALAFGSTSVPVTKSAARYLATVPATVRLSPDVEHHVKLVFVIDQAAVLVVDARLNQAGSL